MVRGRTVLSTNTYSNAPFNHTVTDVHYTDGTIEQFGPLSGFTPIAGDTESLDSLTYGRIGWYCIDGTYKVCSVGAFTSPWTQMTFVGTGLDVKVEPTLKDFMEFSMKLGEKFVLIEIEEAGIKEVHSWEDALIEFSKYRAKYDSSKIKLTKLDKDTAKILYGKCDTK